MDIRYTLGGAILFFPSAKLRRVFSIFYFHKEDGPYQMEYNSQGKFNRDFGPGFYDEAGSLTLKMIKELRKKQAK